MKKSKKLTALFLAVIMLVTSLNISALSLKNDEAVTSLEFTTVSDIHFYPYSLTGDDCSAWQEYCQSNFKLFRQSEAITRTALDTMIARNKDLKYIFVPGDLTRDGEYEGHLALAEIFAEYESTYGVEFIVINGNHDINSTDAASFENGVKEQTRSITAAEFREVYADFGYDLAFEEYAQRGDNVQGQLSYAIDFDEGYRLIVVDSCIYSFDEPAAPVTGGTIPDELMQWIKTLADGAYNDSKTPMVMIHHSLAPHMKIEPSITADFILDDYLDVAETFASWGIHYAFTGHLHTDDVASVVNDDGEVLYDIETASVTSFPCTYRENKISTLSDSESTMESLSVDFDAAAPFTFDGFTYEKGTYKHTAFSTAYGGLTSDDGYADVTQFLMGIVRNALGGILADIQKSGSISAYLEGLDINLKEIITSFLEPYIGDGISVMGYEIFTADNITWFIEDLLGQIYDLYVKNPENLYAILEEFVNRIVSIEVSSYPCTKLLDDYHIGDTEKPGTLGDAVLSVMTYWCLGDEDLADDVFMQDVISNFESREATELVFDTLVDALLHGIIEDNILSGLEIRLDKLLGDNFLGKHTAKQLNKGLRLILKDDFSYMNLVNVIFSLEILPYADLYDILDKELMQKYLTDSQFEGTGNFIAYVLSDFSTDSNPIEKGDLNVCYSTAPVKVVPTRENYRLPTNISVTPGEDSATTANISWYSKSTLGGDIEIYKSDSEPVFTSTPTVSSDTDFSFTLSSETVTRSYFGIDIGIIGFINYEFDINRHIVSLSNLEPGATYYYRVGNAERGWWSETGSITTADNSKEVTFIHVADPQSQTENQYERSWATVLDKAFDAFPETDFIINTGDLVDHGDNFKQWAYMFNTASDTLTNTFMLPASGNHEGHGTDAIVNYFVLPGMPKQDTSTGVYYSYDYNNAHFAVINSNDLNEDEALTDEQIEWLTQDLMSSSAQWKFVVIHKAVYSQGSHYADDDVCAIRNQLSVIMPALDVDMVFQGHDHVYMRTGSLDSNRKIGYEKAYLNYDGNVYKTQVLPDGTSYVISGTCGVKTYLQNDPSVTDDYFPRAEAILAVDAPMFSAIRIVDGILYFDAYTVTEDGINSVDRFAIQKDTTQGDINTEYVEDDSNDAADSTLSEFIGGLRGLFDKFLKVIKIMKNLLAVFFS